MPALVIALTIWGSAWSRPVKKAVIGINPHQVKSNGDIGAVTDQGADRSQEHRFNRRHLAVHAGTGNKASTPYTPR
jgi:hypothetical protein